MNGARTIVTVDGLAGSGKTTLSRLLAERLGFRHLNSGLLYRAAAWLALKGRVDPANGPKVVDILSSHLLTLSHREGLGARVSVDQDDVTDLVRTPQVSEATSILAAQPAVRAALIGAQRDAFAGEHMVAEGRDMGTVVFPDARVKFFVVADEEVRIKRRIDQLGVAPGIADQMKIEIAERDRRDQTRAISPTIAAPDAETIDNSSQPLTSVVDSMYHAVLSRTGL